MRPTRPPPSLVISLIALFVALGGTSYAVATNAIGTKQIKDNSIRSSDIADNSITGKDVHSGSLQSSDFKAGSLPAGARGPAGPAGPRGFTGVAGADGAKQLRAISVVGAASATVSTAKAQCNSDERAVGAGAHVNIVSGAIPILSDSSPMNESGQQLGSAPLPQGGGWSVTYTNQGPGSIQTFAWVICAKP